MFLYNGAIPLNFSVSYLQTSWRALNTSESIEFFMINWKDKTEAIFSMFDFGT